ncbi:MAG: hypothetical protein ACTIJJ_10375 [Galactobacter sp.]|uniref:hypothetical protein n=1 Tax=Galactobacter sp. TaxID=2676125 RepID=UPI0025C57767|nr:hypothetical protein [Galactobacter sp.]
MSGADRIDDVVRLRERVAQQLSSGVPVPEAALGLEASLRFVEATDEDGLVGALEDQDDEFVADVVEALRALDLKDAAEQVGAAWNWIADGFAVEAADHDPDFDDVDDDEAGDPDSESTRSKKAAKIADVVEALDTRWEKTLDSEALETALAEAVDADPEAYGL